MTKAKYIKIQYFSKLNPAQLHIAIEDWLSENPEVLVLNIQMAMDQGICAAWVSYRHSPQSE